MKPMKQLNLQKIKFDWGLTMLPILLVSILFLVLTLNINAAHAKAITFENLRKKMETANVENIDGFLDMLKKDSTTSSLFSNFTLHPNPKGGQKGSPLFPRAILFSKDLLLTFTGDPNLVGGDTVEMIFFTQDKEFEFRNIQFPNEKNLLNSVNFSAKNPPQCLGCHRGRPNWERYREWTGVYGKNDDAITLDVSQFSYNGFTGDPVEHTQFLRYLQESSHRGLYKYLSPPEGSPVSPFAVDKEFPDFRFRPNLRLGETLNEMNAERAFHRLKQSPDFKKLRAGILLADESTQFLTDEERKLIAKEFHGDPDFWNPDSSLLKSKSIWKKFMPAIFSVLKQVSLTPHDSSLEFDVRTGKLPFQKLLEIYDQSDSLYWDYYDGARSFSNRHL